MRKGTKHTNAALAKMRAAAMTPERRQAASERMQKWRYRTDLAPLWTPERHQRVAKKRAITQAKKEARIVKRKAEAQELLREAKQMREDRLDNPVVHDPSNPWLSLGGRKTQ